MELAGAVRQCKLVGKALGCFLPCQAGLSTRTLLDTCLQHAGHLVGGSWALGLGESWVGGMLH